MSINSLGRTTPKNNSSWSPAWSFHDSMHRNFWVSPWRLLFSAARCSTRPTQKAALPRYHFLYHHRVFCIHIKSNNNSHNHNNNTSLILISVEDTTINEPYQAAWVLPSALAVLQKKKMLTRPPKSKPPLVSTLKKLPVLMSRL